jgi:DNA-binding transcriptional ArsR family regulator
MTLGDFPLGLWFPAREGTVGRRTYARDVKAVEHHRLPHLGDTPLRRLQPEHLRSLHQQLLAADGHRCKPLSAKTVLNAHQLLRSALGDAVERGLISSNPAASVRPPDPRRRPSGRRRAKSWTATELGAFIAATADGQPTVSHHLAMLVDAGLLTQEKRGKWAWYRIVPERLAMLRDALAPRGPEPLSGSTRSDPERRGGRRRPKLTRRGHGARLP